MSARFRLIVAIGLVVSLFAASLSAAAQENDTDDDGNDDDIVIGFDHEFEIHGFEFERPLFYNVWERTDRPVLEGDVERSWLWGPAANTEVFDEPYVEAEDGTRAVQYGDKSRMEMPVPGSDAAADDEESPWNITQGLLALELMTGNLQLGDDTFLPFAPADIPVAGDWEDNPGPTYAHMAQFMDWDPRPGDSIITQYLDLEADVVLDDERFAEYEVTDVAGVWQEVEGIDNNIASVFWEFMQSEGLVYEDGDLTTGPVFLDEFYAIGYPVTEAYWGVYTLRGEQQDILTQCFERRCLTYAPNNPEEWQVESGNVGLHYHEWRYNIIDEPLTPDPELTLALSPEDATNTVGTDYTLTVTVMENDTAQEIASVDDVSITVARGEDADVNVDEDITLDAGVATVVYTGPEAPAVDTITVSVDFGAETLTATTTKTWIEAAPEPELSLVLDPEEATNPVGTEFSLTATVMENGTSVGIDDVDDVAVTVARGDDDDVDVNESVELDNGSAVISYTGPLEAGVDTITVSVDVNGQAVSGTATKTWTLGPVEDAEALTLAQDSGLNPVGEPHTVVATVTNGAEDGEPVQGVVVTFDVDGVNDAAAGVGVTNESGEAEFTYTGTEAGDDTITASVVGTDLEEDILKVWTTVEIESTATDAGDVDEAGDDTTFWRVVLRDADGDQFYPLDTDQILWERPDGSVMELDHADTRHLYLQQPGQNGQYAEGDHTFYYLIDDTWIAVEVTFNADGELIAVGGEDYPPAP